MARRRRVRGTCWRRGKLAYAGSPSSGLKLVTVRGICFHSWVHSARQRVRTQWRTSEEEGGTELMVDKAKEERARESASSFPGIPV